MNQRPNPPSLPWRKRPNKIGESLCVNGKSRWERLSRWVRSRWPASTCWTWAISA
ncbi:MAG: hypothetical protein E5W63_06415 [Mesorhizobium sp.]|nr:MAG: hypothetical protein E5W63_06415 [Mesorhizobium sp.]